jgi:REP element-mobilizing transposase RayT
MPRTMRVEYRGAIYHVMDRGDQREDIFVDDVDRQDLLKTLAEACQKTRWQEHAYCLMRNRFHLALETPNANLVEGMCWFLSAYPIRLNHRQKLFETTLPIQWIAARLQMQLGTAKSLKLILRHLQAFQVTLLQVGDLQWVATGGVLGPIASNLVCHYPLPAAPRVGCSPLTLPGRCK